MKNRLFTAILFVFSVVHLNAANGDVIKVVYNGGTADVDIPSTASVKCAVNGAYVTLSSTTTAEEYVYDVTGSTTDGSLTIIGDYKLTLRLNGVSIQSGKGEAINVDCGKRIAIELVEGTTNTLVDYADGSQKAALYTTGHPEFSGAGTLNVSGKAKHAIAAKEYLQIKKSVGTINVLSAVSDGIHCGKGKEKNENNYFQMNGGVLNISGVGSDCIDSDDYGTVLIKGGELNLEVSASDVDGIKADSVLTIADGTVNIDVKGAESTGIKSNWETYIKGGNVTINVSGDGSKGIKGKRQTGKTVNDGGSVFFSDSADVRIVVSGGNVVVPDDTTKCMGISVDADLTHTGGSVYILAKGAEARTYNVKGTEAVTKGFVAEYETPSAVSAVEAETVAEEEIVYSVQGIRQNGLQKGINIVKGKGTPARKVVVR